MPVLFSLLLLSCSAPKKTAHSSVSEDQRLAPWILKYDKGPCFSECPVYTFYLLDDHTGLLDVKAQFLERGWYAASLDQELVERIRLDIEPESIWNEDHSQLPEIEELPPLAMVYKHSNGLRWYSTQSKISHHFSETSRQLHHMISEAMWSPTTQRPFQPDLPEPYDVIVQLRPDIDIQIWMKKFDRFGITLKRKVAPRLQYYVVSKDPSKGLSSHFLQQIKADPDVIEAQWDQALTPRQE